MLKTKQNKIRTTSMHCSVSNLGQMAEVPIEHIKADTVSHQALLHSSVLISYRALLADKPFSQIPNSLAQEAGMLVPI